MRRAGQILLPPSSPDSKPFGYFLRKYLNDIVYHEILTQFTTWGLKAHRQLQVLAKKLLKNVYKKMKRGLCFVLREGVDHFEHPRR